MHELLDSCSAASFSTARVSQVFSASNSFKHLAWSTFMPPYSLRQR
jgi:hypothetical protein